MDTSYGLDWFLKVRQEENVNTGVIVNVLNALIRLGDTGTYHKLKHLQNNSNWTAYTKKEIESNKPAYSEISVAMNTLRREGYHVEQIVFNDIYTHYFSEYTLCAINISHCIIV